MNMRCYVCCMALCMTINVHSMDDSTTSSGEEPKERYYSPYTSRNINAFDQMMMQPITMASLREVIAREKNLDANQTPGQSDLDQTLNINPLDAMMMQPVSMASLREVIARERKQ